MFNLWRSSSILERMSMSFILICAMASVFAYLLITDTTHNANNQQLESALLPPFSKQQFIEIREEGSFHWFHGYKGSLTTAPLLEVLAVDQEIGRLEYSDQLGNTQFLTHARFKGKNLTEITDLYIKEHWFVCGTDRYGRDVLSRILLGIRISLLAGCIAVFIATVIGVLIGLLSGYFGGWIDKATMFVINSLWAFPTILFVFAIVMAFGRSISIIFIAVGCTLWIDVARLIRGKTKQLKEETYVKAAQSYGASAFRIAFRHILPNTLGPLLVLTAANFAIAILIEAGLSYLGFGVSPPTPSLGNMLNENYGFALSGILFLAIIPAVVIMLLVLSFNFTSQAIRNYIAQ